jgi:lipoate-protein ligase A
VSSLFPASSIAIGPNRFGLISHFIDNKIDQSLCSRFEPPLSMPGRLNAFMKFFERLTIYQDLMPRSAAMNMAIDEALLETAVVPTIRFYRWRSPALSFGYFGKFSDVAIYAAERDLVRRWTGGGIVFHGEDLTYSIVIPSSDPVFDESSIAIYEKIHRALCEALNKIGKQAVVAGGVDPGRLVDGIRAAVSASGYNCFANPVPADVMMDGRKIAGAAQRRTRRGLLQQGSIQGITMKTDLAQKFAQALSANCSEFKVNEEIYRGARELVQQKYGTESWLRKR